MRLPGLTKETAARMGDAFTAVDWAAVQFGDRKNTVFARAEAILADAGYRVATMEEVDGELIPFRRVTPEELRAHQTVGAIPPPRRYPVFIVLNREGEQVVGVFPDFRRLLIAIISAYASNPEACVQYIKERHGILKSPDTFRALQEGNDDQFAPECGFGERDFWK